MSQGFPGISPNRELSWTDKLYQSKLKAGLEPRLTAILPDRPSRRIDETWGEVYEYDTELLPYRTAQDERFARIFHERMAELMKAHGVVNVVEIPLPDEFLIYANPDYPRRNQYLIMARPQNPDLINSHQ